MPEIERGFERDRLDGREPFRWWLYMHVMGRPQRPRRGVVDHGFHFARGGRCETEDDCKWALIEAHRQAEIEMRIWQLQPSHLLGDRGQLIPVDEVQDEKRRIEP